MYKKSEMQVQSCCFVNRNSSVFLLLSFKLPSRSQMTSKCGKNKEVAQGFAGRCVTDVFTSF